MIFVPMLRSTTEKQCIEVRPRPDWNKARAMEWVIETTQSHVSRHATSKQAAMPVLPIYLGDMKADTEAFASLRAESKDAITVVLTENQALLQDVMASSDLEAVSLPTHSLVGGQQLDCLMKELASLKAASQDPKAQAARTRNRLFV